MGRTPCCEKIGLKKGPWTPEEDQKLIDYISKHGQGSWRTLPKNAGLERCGKSCRLRWTNYLRPDIKRGRFSLEEEEMIIQLHSVLGNKWSAIAARLPGRTDNEIKNYWNTHIRKKLLRMGIDPVTHTPRLDLFDFSSILSTSSLCNSSHQFNPHVLQLVATLLSTQQQQQQQQQQKRENNICPEFQSFHDTTTAYDHHDQANSVQQFDDQSNFSNTSTDFGYQDSNMLPGHNAGTTTTTTTTSTELGLQDYGYLVSENNDLLSEQNLDFQCNYYGGNQLQALQQCGLVSSVMSTPSSSSTPMNSSSTYINGSSTAYTTEDERDSYCSTERLMFEIANGFM
ncbi:hypothetical protein Syun_010450 [Stephania yunnanensis]|uniref:Uncharacterized protein n=1 Tax=Stephania yunnanensis TaxID=152371 RepID=A0AAP0PT97_9MAGN